MVRRVPHLRPAYACIVARLRPGRAESFRCRPLVLAVAAAIAAALFWQPTAALGCSAQPGELPPPDVVAEGWVERITARPDLPSGDLDSHMPAEVALRGARLLHGAAQLPLTFLDLGSVRRDTFHSSDGSVTFSGAAGACGVLDRDETGRYVVVSLWRADDGRLHSNRLLGFVSVDAAQAGNDPRIGAARRAALRLLPAAGAGSAPVGTDAAVLGTALLAAGALLRSRREPHTKPDYAARRGPDLNPF